MAPAGLTTFPSRRSRLGGVYGFPTRLKNYLTDLDNGCDARIGAY